MPINSKGYITGGRVSSSGKFFTSKEYRKNFKMSFFDKVIFFVGVALLVNVVAFKAWDFPYNVTPETGFTFSQSYFSSLVFDLILGFYNVALGLRSKFLIPKFHKRLLLASIACVLVGLAISVFSLLDGPVLKFEDWAKTRYGVTEVSKDVLYDGRFVSYQVDSEYDVAKIVEKDGLYYLYNPNDNKELPLKINQ